MKKEKSCAFTLRLPESLKLQLELEAVKNDRSLNSLIVTILKEYIEKK